MQSNLSLTPPSKVGDLPEIPDSSQQIFFKNGVIKDEHRLMMSSLIVVDRVDALAWVLVTSSDDDGNDVDVNEVESLTLWLYLGLGECWRSSGDSDLDDDRDLDLLRDLDLDLFRPLLLLLELLLEVVGWVTVGPDWGADGAFDAPSALLCLDDNDDVVGAGRPKHMIHTHWNRKIENISLWSWYIFISCHRQPMAFTL